MDFANSILVLSQEENAAVVRQLIVKETAIPDELNGENGFHIYHVRVLTELILRQLKETEAYPLAEQDIEAISMASSLHDVGKSKVPKSILDYPGRLSPLEYDIVKKHADFGGEILENTRFEDDLLKKHAVEIARYHHERYDGTGYPEGLKGDKIPLSAQVVALADAYDALTSSRSYKEAFSQDVAIQMLASGMSGVFDERLIECLMHVVNHSSLLALRETLYKNRSVVSAEGGFAPERVLCIGNTEYLTEAFVEDAFPGSKVTVVGNTVLGSADKIKLFRIKKPSIKAVLETYDFDVVVYFSGDLTYQTTEKNDAEELREVLEYAKATGKDMKILFLSSLDAAFTEKTDRAILSEAKEKLCAFYANSSSLDIKVIQIPYLYSGSYSKDFLYKMFDRIHRRKIVHLEALPQTQAHFIALSDLAQLIARMLDNWKCQSGILSVGDDFSVTFTDLTKKTAELCDNAQFTFATVGDSGKLNVNNKGLRNEYGWFAKISVLEELEEEYQKYQSTKQEKDLTLWQKIRKWLEQHGMLVKITELLLLFIFTEFLLRITDTTVIFSIVDFRMAYIVVMATVHGLYFGLAASALSSVSWLFAKVASGTNVMTIFYEPTNWLAFVLFFLVGSLCGYVKLRKDDTIRFVSEQNKLLEDKLVFTRDIYEDTYKEKRDLKKQIIGSKDSFGKIFDITRKLDTVAPQLLYLRIIETFEEVLENKTISVYSVNGKSPFGRLEVASRDIMQMVSRSISTETYAPVIDKIGGDEIWRNTDLKPEYPMYAAGVYRGEDLVLLIFLWRAETDQHSLYYVNLFKILRDLVQMSMLRAYDYSQAIYEKQYIPGTRIMHAEAFAEVLDNYIALTEKKVSAYLLLEIDMKGRTCAEMDGLLHGKVRTGDIIGVAENGKLQLLMPQATEKDLPNILPRFKDFQIEVK